MHLLSSGLARETGGQAAVKSHYTVLYYSVAAPFPGKISAAFAVSLAQQLPSFPRADSTPMGTGQARAADG
ncbi:hypothetical protein ATCC90586_002997 [Pythium insidiosum]|nr:hypothetical protein ATCC90586_002997 [Pythium insidiosum]